MISLKQGVRVADIKAGLLLGLMVVDSIYEQSGYPTVVTSITDGQHMDGSLHYKGQAADIRTRDIAAPVLTLIVKNTKESLGMDYDVVLEGNHLHLEWDPK